MPLIESLAGTLLFACGYLLYATVWGYQRTTQWFGQIQSLVAISSLSAIGGAITLGVDSGVAIPLVAASILWAIIIAPGTPGHGGLLAGAAGYGLVHPLVGRSELPTVLTADAGIMLGSIAVVATTTVGLAYFPTTRTPESGYRLPFDQLIYTYYRGMNGSDSHPLLARHHFGIYLFGEWYAREIVYRRYLPRFRERSDDIAEAGGRDNDIGESGASKDFGGSGNTLDPYRVEASNVIVQRSGPNAPRVILSDGTSIDLVVDEENPEESPYRASDMRPIDDVLAANDHVGESQSLEDVFRSALGGYGYRFGDEEYQAFADAAHGLSADDIRSIADKCKREVQQSDSDLTKGQVLAKIDDRQSG